MNKLKDRLLILNEKKYSEQIINDDLFILPRKYYNYLVLIAKYYSDNGHTKKEIKKLLQNYMDRHYPPYKNEIDKINKTCGKIAQKYYSAEKQLIEIDEIHITKSEIKKIEEIEELPELNGADKKAMQRLLFTILVFGKWQNMRNPANEKCWCNMDSFSLLEAAKVAKSKLTLLGKLYNLGYIQHQQALDADNCYPLIVDLTDEKPDDTKGKKRNIQIITDLRELGMQWNHYKGDDYDTCKQCGLIVKGGYTHDGLCKDCYTAHETHVIRCSDCGVLFVGGQKEKFCLDCKLKRKKENGKKQKKSDVKTPRKAA